eukprot:Plantae.Rhodophyta-Hildenbrandia_rubra.ctg12964.p2 GENE.Plantae.Rhodophyta-Hildenbrandia_rubra.ctg12964~~Plantae.Rhodophyta-Hildenbrandia_rubra.ctg12964.p2  ORF type:complete len:151 (-),score=10.50 Plantae.Rhodophyta-Hildenbrandia_rubra.ctg12964:488-940(-)
MQMPGCIGKVEGNMRGAKQACEVYETVLATHLTKHGFQRIAADATAHMLKKPEASHFALLAVTIDDFLTASNNRPLLDRAKEMLHLERALKDLGAEKHILKWKVRKAPTYIKISQPACVRETLEANGMKDCCHALDSNGITICIDSLRAA